MVQYTISFFKGYADTCPTAMPLQAVVELIQQSDPVRERTEKYRYFLAHGQERAAAREKAGTPCFAVAALFRDGKSEKHLTAWSGLSLVDLDHIPDDRLPEVIRLVREDRHTLLSYVTISGKGLRILFRVEGLTQVDSANRRAYVRAFLAGNDYYAQLTGCTPDLKCKNPTRLSGLAHDAQVFFRPEAEPFAATEEPSATASSSKGKSVSRKVIAAIRKEVEAQGAAYAAGRHNDYIMRFGYLLNAYGIPQEVATAWALKRFTDYQGDVAGILRSCYQQTDEHGSRSLPKAEKRAAEGNDSAATVADIEEFLGEQGKFRFNVITGKTEFSLIENGKMKIENAIQTTSPSEWVELDDRMLNSLWGRMCKQQGWVRINDLRAVLHSEFVPVFNPFEEYFHSLPPWDGTSDYICELADRVTVKGDEQPFFRTFFKKWLVAAVGSMLDNEVVNHEILVLIGPQGCYKTTWMNHLLPPLLRRYFYVKSNSNRITKDDLFSLTEFAIICLEEIDELSGAENNQLKALVSKPEVNERVAYGHYKERRPHLASFCATTNNLQFLTDLSGSRRWLPVEVESIRSPFDHPVNYTGVYAQAYALFRGNYPYFLSPDEIAMLNERNRRFEVPCLEFELIQMCYEVPSPDSTCAIFVTTTRILNRLNGMVKQLLSPTKIGIAMKKLGFQSLRSNGKRGYRVIELDGERIRAKERIIGIMNEEL